MGFLSGLTGIVNNTISSLTSTVQTIANNRTDRNINRDTLQAEVMAKTGKNTQADKYNLLASLSKDGASTNQAMSGDAKGLVASIFGGALFSKDGDKTEALFPAGGTSATGGNWFSKIFTIKNLLVATGIFLLWRMFRGKKGKRK